jgi:predicted transcriptional regulator
MTNTTTLTIRVPVSVKEELDGLARNMRRSRSFLAAEAVTSYVAREAEIVAGVMRARADFAAGRYVSHEEAMSELHDAIAEVATRKSN